MINQISVNVLREDVFPQNSIFVVMTNAAGVGAPGAMQNLAKKYPKWFTEYRRHCMLFVKHENELMGSIHAFNVDSERIIVSCFSYIGMSKNVRTLDYGAFENTLRKIEYQTKVMNERQPRQWQLYMPESSLTQNGANQVQTMDIITRIFGSSPVQLNICRG